ncbi:protein FRA10AC1 [Belonocnema kinseyi]|uniref:protein FRA10AC1 n=1 Tax=Belonocnema kinseyi TaxID=2817044 RepID=UPI00143E0D6C|nr:protein FRA10AC1 [Belonocnema kinseyi]
MFSANMYLSAYDRHKKIINDYLLLRNGSLSDFKRDTSRDKTDLDVIRENHKFLWNEEDEPETWESRLAKKYYDKLFKEYCISDLTYFKYNKIALRWRTEKEVITGKGQFECGSKKCTIKDGLRSWEVNFAYEEDGEKKNALVKLRLCPECSIKLNYRSQKREVKRRKALKRLGKSSTSKEISGSSSDQEIEIKDEPESEAEPASTEEQVAADVESEIWREKPSEDEEKTREQEFEEYLADLFL